MKIITWNVNGIRSRIFNDKISSKLKKEDVVPILDSPIDLILKEHSPDLICFQETRCGITKSEKIKINGYNSFFNESKLDGARSCDRYSGTAIFYKENLTVLNIETSIPGFQNDEGRIIIMYLEEFTIINVYAPNSGTNYDSKINFINCMLSFLDKLEGKVIFCGDMNIAVSTHFDRTLVEPSPGIYPHEINFYKQLLDINFKDSISADDNIIYTWWDLRQKKENGMSVCRNRNKGWRLDYFFIKNINQAFSVCLKHIGENNLGIPLASDHAPVLLTYYKDAQAVI